MSARSSFQSLFGRIVVLKRNGDDGSSFPLAEKQCLFGRLYQSSLAFHAILNEVFRHPDCDIRIQLPHVSQQHAMVSVDDTGKVGFLIR